MRRFLLMLTVVILAATCIPLSAPATGSAAKEKAEYAWILVDVLDFENAEKWEASDAHVAYAYSYSYSRASYSASVTYEGDDPYGEGLKGTLGLNAVFTGIPTVIYPDKPVSIKLSFTTTKNDVVKLVLAGSASANFDKWDMSPGAGSGSARALTNEDGIYHFTISAVNGPSSYSETLTATLSAGREGNRIALRTIFFLGATMGTNYVYEWREVGSTVPYSETTTTTKWTTSIEYRPPPSSGLIEGLCIIGDLYGEVNVRSNDEDDDAYIFAWSGMNLYHNDRVRTLPRSGCIISFDDMSTYVMEEDSTIVLDIPRKNVSKIALIAGDVWVNIQRVMQDGALEIEMSQAIAGARGTTFICQENNGVSTVKVFEGTVEVTAKATGESVMVGGGEMLSTDSAGQGTLEAFDIDAELAGRTEYVRKATAAAIKKANRKGILPFIIAAAAVILLAAGGAAIVSIFRQNKRKAMFVPPYASPAQPSKQPRFCPNCGALLGESGEFCGKCGNRIS